MTTQVYLTTTPIENDGDNLRFPKDAWESDDFKGPIHLKVESGVPAPPSIRKAFEGDYPERTVKTVARLSQEHWFDFEETARTIAPEAWRFLFYAGTFTLEALASPLFHPGTELRDLCNPNAFESPPAEFLGSKPSAEGIADELEVILREFDEAKASAIWAVLSAAQAIHLNKAELLACEWWEPYWIRMISSLLEDPKNTVAG